MVMTVPPARKPRLRFRAIERVKSFIKPLVEACVDKIARNFLSYDVAELTAKLTKRQMDRVYELLDRENLPIHDAAERISDEPYWQRRTIAKWPNAQVLKHGMSWKQAYLELALWQMLDNLPLDYPEADYDEIVKLVRSSRRYIFSVEVHKFASHLPLNVVFDNLLPICRLQLTYGEHRLGMDYDRTLFGMKISDARNLSRNLRVQQTLVILSLPCNMIDDELIKVLMDGLDYATTLTELDLSHNKICDRGARSLAKLLGGNHCLQTLDLSDNQIHANGCMHLGARLADNTTLEKLNMRLNRCEDNGVSHLFQDLCSNVCLKELNISNNDLTMRCLPYLSAFLGENPVVHTLDVSGNPLWTEDKEESDLPEDDAIDQFVETIMESTTLLHLDVRRCDLPDEIYEQVTTAIKHLELRTRGIPIEPYEQKKLDMEKAKADAEAEAAGAAEAEGEDGEENGEEGEDDEDED